MVDSWELSKKNNNPRILTGEGKVTADQCDVMGHFTTRYYTAAFDDASYVLLEACGLKPDGKTGFVDLELNTKFFLELREGVAYYIKSSIIALGNSSFKAVHYMHRVSDDDIVAICEEKAVVFDLEERKSMPMPEEFRKLASKFLVD